LNRENLGMGMPDANKLKDLLSGINGRGYKAYKQIKGKYAFSTFTLLIDHVQGDPFAAPSRIRVCVKRSASGFASTLSENKSRRIALCDYLTRSFFRNCRQYSRGNRGTGKSGLITIDKPNQEVLETTAMKVDNQAVEARFCMGLPAQGRRILGRDAAAMFFEELPKIVSHSLFFTALDPNSLKSHVDAAEDADYLRSRLPELSLIGFVANDCLLARTSGIDPTPLDNAKSVRFQSPPSLQTEIELPNKGVVSGMGIPKGVTLIVGGGYHGKSTLLNALELGIYNHLPGDGRELVVTLPEAVKIRAADGRSIKKTDISPFINNLPFERNTHTFTTQNASGSTSQAANISEALEAGAKVLFLDEDTSATNFMIRDQRMQQLVVKDQEPITPFVDRVRQLYAQQGISTVLVMGGSGDYFSEAHQVIQMINYRPKDVTTKAHLIAQDHPTGRLKEAGSQFGEIGMRIPQAKSLNPYRGKRLKITATRMDEIQFGTTIIDLKDVEQIVHPSQTRGIALAMHYATRYMDGSQTLKQVIDQVMHDIDTQSLDLLSAYIIGDIARFRGLELAAAINRLRTLKMKQEKS